MKPTITFITALLLSPLAVLHAQQERAATMKNAFIINEDNSHFYSSRPAEDMTLKGLNAFKTPNEKKHWSVGGVWVAPWRLADDYHVYGLEWTPEEIKYYVDGVVVRTVENTHWHQPLFMIFDSETMPNWFGMPKDEDLPSTYSVEYVRAWKQE
jgi:hypothetical protein